MFIIIKINENNWTNYNNNYSNQNIRISFSSALYYISKYMGLAILDLHFHIPDILPLIHSHIPD